MIVVWFLLLVALIMLVRQKPPVCAVCDAAATCFGEYGTCDGSGAGYACDDCCAHGNEDGWCEDLDILRDE